MIPHVAEIVRLRSLRHRAKANTILDEVNGRTRFDAEAHLVDRSTAGLMSFRHTSYSGQGDFSVPSE